MADKSRMFLIEVDGKTEVSTHDEGYAKKAYLDKCRLNKRKVVQLIEYQSVKVTTSTGSYIKRA
jgi:hypothetical protein